jgi:pimeloyl-ACP methyl ester carboxylesterase
MATQTTAMEGYADVNGLRLHYLEWGSPTAEPIVMLHGLRSAARTFAPLAETAQAMADANPQIRWVEIPGASHTVHSDNLADYNRAPAQFLRELESRQPRRSRLEQQRPGAG